MPDNQTTAQADFAVIARELERRLLKPDSGCRSCYGKGWCWTPGPVPHGIHGRCHCVVPATSANLAMILSETGAPAWIKEALTVLWCRAPDQAIQEIEFLYTVLTGLKTTSRKTELTEAADEQ